MVRKIIVAGGRDLEKYELVCRALDKVLSSFYSKGDEVIIVSGKAKGADRLGEVYANNHNLEVEEYPADWEKNGKSAGFIRNSLMANNAEYLVAFWDGKSKGTKMMINLAGERGLSIRVIRY
jgi:hypothetical protein